MLSRNDSIDFYDSSFIKDLRESLAEEKRKNFLLEDSLEELNISIDELMKRVDQADDESNEWKTRFENQLEVNDYLHVQSQNLTQKISEAKTAIKEVRSNGTLKAVPKANPDFIKALERNKKVANEQLKNLEMRLDQETKAYHRSNEERKNMLLELNGIRNSVDLQKQPPFNITSTNYRAGMKKT